MANRVEAPDSLDLFPTPPWGTRALIERLLLRVDPWLALDKLTALDPCAGLAHMSDVLAEAFGKVLCADVHDYGLGHEVGSFVGDGPDRLPAKSYHWGIFNPPFNLAFDFVARALGEAEHGVAALLRSQWAEGKDRYRDLFKDNPPDFEAVFAERLPMHRGVWKPDGDSATSYSWFVWWPAQRLRNAPAWLRTRKVWIAPGQRFLLAKDDDVRRFAMRGAAELPIFGGEIETDLEEEGAA